MHQHTTNLGLGFGDALKWGAGTAIGQRAVDAFLGPRESKVEVHEVKVPPTQCPEYGEKKAAMHACIETGRNCAAEIKAFERCIDGKQ